MAFPHVPRVIYENNPLDEVICQLRFPAILKIDTELPSLFQERLREAFPIYQSKTTMRFPGMPAEIADVLAKSVPPITGNKAHEFQSRDGYWTVSLTREFVALTCKKYERWDEFRDNLSIALTALIDIYQPVFFTRIGLRYQDVIRRSRIGLANASWDELLKPWIAGVLGSECAQDVEHAAQELLFRLPDDRSRVRVHHGIVSASDDKEQCYMIDADFFDEQQTETADAIPRLAFLNRQSRLFFRWCIDDRLHEAMRPRSIPEA